MAKEPITITRISELYKKMLKVKRAAQATSKAVKKEK